MKGVVSVPLTGHISRNKKFDVSARENQAASRRVKLGQAFDGEKKISSM